MPHRAFEASRVLFVFLDGVGIGPDDRSLNPFLRADLPTLTGLLDGSVPTLSGPERTSDRAAAFPLDATLGVEGTPRSGTGQTTLLTGRNAARRHGGHFGPWTPVRLRPLLEEESLLRRAVDRGFRVTFANACPRGYPDALSSRMVPPVALAARSAGLLDRHGDALARGEAVASEIVNHGWRTRLHLRAPEITPGEAGSNLSRIAGRHHLTLYAHYATDRVGHRKRMDEAVEALERVDAFLEGVLEALPEDTVLVVASDHGNIEDVGEQHTRHPALGLVVPPDTHRRSARLESIADVAGSILSWLDLS